MTETDMRAEGTPDPYTTGIVVRGLAAAAERLVALIPVAERARWTRILVAEEAPDLPPREGFVYVLFLRAGRSIAFPVSEAALEAAGSVVAGWLAARAGELFDNSVSAASAPDGTQPLIGQS